MRKIFLLIMGVIIMMTLSTKANAEGIKLEKRDSKAFFQMLNKDTMGLVDQFYAEDIHFIDPIVEFDNRVDLKNYYDNLYKDTSSVTFEVPTVINEGNEQTIIWVMTLKTKKLNKGKPIIVPGSSHIRYNEEGKAIYHRDYFDMGEMVYSHVPIVRGMVKFVKKRMKKNHE
jgi:hypothetical protein